MNFDLRFLRAMCIECQNITWYHIPGSHNWADLAFRGCNARQLIENKWWEGSPWLVQPPNMWPKSTLVVDEKEASKELTKSACINTCYNNCNNGIINTFTYFSIYTKIIRMLAWILRFAYNTQPENVKKKGELTYEEYERAENKMLKIIQTENKEVLDRHTGKLTKFYDKNNILRIKTKLSLTDFPENVKTPVVILAKNVIIQRMIEQRHLQLLHAGSNIMITDLRKQFWIIGIKRLVNLQ